MQSEEDSMDGLIRAAMSNAIRIGNETDI
jgi:hypothetical protein